MKLRYKLTGTGWAETVLEDEERAVTISASYLSDALGDLARSALAVFRGSSITFGKRMKNVFLSLVVLGFVSSCATPKPAVRLPAGVLVGTVKSVSFSGLSGPKEFIAVGEAHLAISSPAALAGKDLLVESSDDYPFKIGDEVELDLTDIGIDVRSDGQLYTVMLYRFPIKIRPKSPQPTAPSRRG